MKLDYFNIEKGDIIVNLGAHQGTATLFFASKVGETGKVISIEPMNNNYRVLLEAVLKSGYNNVVLFNVAIGEETKMDKLYIGTNSVNYSTTRNHGLGAQPIRVVTWDDLIEWANLKNVSLAKVDVEGAELQWIKGMTQVLPKHIIMEEHTRFGYDLKTLTDMLKEKGYTYSKEGLIIYATRERKT